MTHAHHHQTKFRWTESLTCRFIQLRKENGKLFTGRKYSAQAGWEFILQQMRQEFPTIMADVHYRVLKKKWSNLLQQYKELRNPVHGDRNKADDVSWPFYGAIDEVIGYGRRTSNNTDEYIDPHEFLCVSVTPEEPTSPSPNQLPAESKVDVESRRPFSSSTMTQGTRLNSDECSIAMSSSHLRDDSNRQSGGTRARRKGACKEGPISRLSGNAELSISRISAPRSSCDPRDDPSRQRRNVEEADSAPNGNRGEERPRKLRRNRAPCHEDHDARVDRRLELFFEYVRRRDEENRSIMMRILHAVESIANKL